MRRMITIGITMLSLVATTKAKAYSGLNAQGMAENFPGGHLSSSASRDTNVFGDLEYLRLYQFDQEFPVVKEDENFRYRSHQKAIFREYKKIKPTMSYADTRPIPTAPGLFWPGVFEFYSDQSAPARPNCTERPFGYSDYMDIVNDPNTKTKADFLKRIPKDSLQKFTFIHKSLSLQQHGVSKETPRVMRFSNDGKFIITYTTNENSSNINGIESIFFDDKTRRYHFLHTEFLTEDQITNGVSSITEKDPKACMSCHGGLDPRPNWQQYQTWPGVYGEDDDQFKKSKDPRVASLDDYTSMLSKLKDTPEISTLPWPHKDSNLYPHYPYASFVKEKNYNLRPNAHFTIASSRLNAQRIARKFQDNPIFEKVKWSFMYQAMDCAPTLTDNLDNPLLRGLINKNSNGYSGEDFLHGDYERGGDHQGLHLYRLGKAFGFLNSDWNTTFTEKPGKEMRPFNTAQWQMSDFVLSVLFRDLAKKEPALQPYDIRVNRMSALFGPNFMCIDELADKLWRTRDSNIKSCEIIRRNVELEIQSITSADMKLVEQVQNTIWPERVWSEGFFASIEMGRSIVQNTCVECHQSRAIPFHFKSMNMFSKDTPAAAKAAYTKHIEKVLGNKDACQMPKPIAGPCLTDKQRESVLKYLQSL